MWRLFYQLEQIALDIERRWHSHESLELLLEGIDVALQSLYVMQRVLVEEQSKFNIVNLLHYSKYSIEL